MVMSVAKHMVLCGIEGLCTTGHPGCTRCWSALEVAVHGNVAVNGGWDPD